VVELGDEWEFTTLQPNVLPLTEWSLSMENSIYNPNWTTNGLRFTTTFTADLVPAEARLLLDALEGAPVEQHKGQFFQARLNGEELSFQTGEYFDHYVMEAAVDGILREGRNTFEVWTEGSLCEPAALTQPAFLVGRFAVSGRKRLRLVEEPRTLRAGPWNEQGYPFYSGIATYRQAFKLTSAQAASRLFLEMDAPGDLVEVLVNGDSCGVRAWEPWKLEVTSAVNSGSNDLELRIANSMQNLFIQEPKPSGLLGSVRLVPYKELTFSW
jgi:hypothetical protein